MWPTALSPDATSHSTDLRDSGSWYKHRTRAFHLSQIAWLYALALPSQVHEREASRAKKAVKDVLPVLDFTGVEADLVVLDLKTLQNEESPYPQSFRERRMQDLCRDYVSGSLSPNMRLVKGIFANGPEHDIHLIALLKVDDHAETEPQVEVVYSVPCLRHYTVSDRAEMHL